MAESTPKKAFPLKISFQRDEFEKTFRNRKELDSWRGVEQQYWQKYGPGNGDQPGQAINRNLQILNNISGPDDDTIVSRADHVSESYLPSEGGFCRAVERLRTLDANAARMALWIFLSPQNMQWQNSREFVQGAALVSAYQVLGDPKGGREIIVEAVLSVNKLREAENARTEQFDGLYARLDEEFKQRFDGYEAKMALSAPREYWKERAEEHKNLASIARRKWASGTVALAVVFAVGALVAFTSIGESLSELVDLQLGVKAAPLDGAQPIVVLAGFLKRALVLGGILGIGVWWLRQLLRELRSHEHLAEDAAERVTMIETYAALKAAGLGSEDFAPILTALYCAASTGLVIDDGGGPIFPWEALMKAAISKGREG